MVVECFTLGLYASDPMPCDVSRMAPHAALVDISMKNQPTPVVRRRARGLVAHPGFEEHEPHGRHQTKKATASGWIGSALEYYDFFIYATAASLIFPQIFFPTTDPKVAIVASLATYGVGYVARPIGAFFLGHWGDTHGRKTVLIVCMFLMGFSTMAVGLLPTYEQVGVLAPALLVILRLIQGFAVAGEISGRQLDDPRARSVRPARLLSPALRCRACRPGRSSPRRCSCRSRTTCPRTRSTPGAGAFRSC